MIIQLKFKQLDYSSIVEKFGPVLVERYPASETSVGKLMSMLRQLPFELPFDKLGSTLDLIPQEDKNSFLSSLVDEKQASIITALKDDGF